MDSVPERGSYRFEKKGFGGIGDIPIVTFYNCFHVLSCAIANFNLGFVKNIAQYCIFSKMF